MTGLPLCLILILAWFQLAIVHGVRWLAGHDD
jgi:hypothetical protein